MALPEQIRKQVEAANKHFEQGDAGADARDETPADKAPQVPTNVAAEQPPADNNAETNGANPPTGNEQSPESAGSEVVDENSETYAQKWRSLQGMYNAEVPRLHRQNRELTQRLQQMEQLMATLSAQQGSTPAPSGQAEKFVSDEDVAEYGESIDVMRRVSREEAAALSNRIVQLEGTLRQMQTSVVPQVQAVAHRQAVSADQQFWVDLTQRVPNWRKINDDQKFQDWLLSPDPLTGITRQAYLEDAQAQLDVGRVSNFFAQWSEITGQASNARPSGRSSASSELEKQVTPGRSRGTGAPADNQGKTYTRADISKFFDDVKQGRYKGREAERDRIERDIFAAQRENRILVNA